MQPCLWVSYREQEALHRGDLVRMVLLFLVPFVVPSEPVELCLGKRPHLFVGVGEVQGESLEALSVSFSFSFLPFERVCAVALHDGKTYRECAFDQEKPPPPL